MMPAGQESRSALRGANGVFWRLSALGALAAHVALGVSLAVAEDAASKENGGFFDSDMQVGSTRKPIAVTESDTYQKKAAPPALVPEIERSNGYSVPVRSTPRPSATPTETPTPVPQGPVHTESSKERSTTVPRDASYYQELIGKVKQDSEAPIPTAEPADLKPQKRSQSYRF